HGEWPACMRFDLIVGDRRWRVQTGFVGTLMLTNVLAALSVVHAIGHDLDRAVAELERLAPIRNRQGIVTGRDQHTYFVDTYKAALWSTGLIVADMANWGPARRILVLGDMSDVGHDQGRKYRRVLRQAAETADLVIATGASASRATGVGMPGKVVAAPTVEDVRAVLATQPPSLVLLKGNNSFRLGGVVPSPVTAPLAAV
ncbi:MAG TPA: hypothetical protein VHZ56_13990, partial [Devosia sp.]|nr:hypothetical protein [Devosia sp.]